VKNTITIKGKIVLDPKDYTNKHKAQSSWKKVAMVVFEGDICEYYAWFIKKRYNLPLAMPLRNAHISFINDREVDMNGKWEEVKKKWDGKEVEVVLSVDPRTDSASEKSSMHWWLNIPEEHRGQLHGIRAELGLGRPYWGLHMAIGYARDSDDSDPEIKGIKALRQNVAHSKYIHGLIKKGLIE
jgi:hypothetical protein